MVLMDKSKYFFGNPVFGQLIRFIPRYLIDQLIVEYQCDSYYKKFKTYDHLVTMLYASIFKCESLRELASGMQANHTKLLHLGLKDIPRRSTISDSNANRNPLIFEALYHKLVDLYYGSLSDSRFKSLSKDEQRLFILDSTTITLFSDVMRGAGDKPSDGKRKGGAKAHVLLDAHHDLPRAVRITEAKENDKSMLSMLQLPAQSILVFDRAYRNYKIWNEFTENQITWVTRTIGDETYVITENRDVSKDCSEQGVIADQFIQLGSGINRNVIQPARIVKYKDPNSKQELTFITNNRCLKPIQIANIYKRRWQVEVFFKRLKRHSPLRYFLGNSENAIKIQIWCSLILDLLVKVVKDRVQRKWSFTNLSAIIKHHAMNYIDLLKFLRNPETSLIPKEKLRTSQMKLALF